MVVQVVLHSILYRFCIKQFLRQKTIIISHSCLFADNEWDFSQLIAKIKFLPFNICKVGNNVVSLQRDCGLITPATGLKPWVHISIEAIVSSATSSLMSMLTRHRWYRWSMRRSTLRADTAAWHDAAASASRWRRRCCVPTMTSHATHASCFVAWTLRRTRHSRHISTSIMWYALTWPTSPQDSGMRGR